MINSRPGAAPAVGQGQATGGDVEGKWKVFEDF